MRHLDNQLLARLDEATFAAIEADLQIVGLHANEVLADAGAKVEKVYFPHDGVVTNVVELGTGGTIATAMIGRDGQFGASSALERQTSSNFVVMQVSGTASVIDADRFRSLAALHPELRLQAMAYEKFVVAQTQQTAACNAAHKVAQRICKWLLRMRQLVGDELPMTQEALARMIGVRRSSVSAVAATLLHDGSIAYARGRIRIEEVAQLKAGACECASTLEAEYRAAVASKIGCVFNFDHSKNTGGKRITDRKH